MYGILYNAGTAYRGNYCNKKQVPCTATFAFTMKQAFPIYFYAGCIAADLLLIAWNKEDLRWCTKPLLMPLLAIWVWQKGRKIQAFPKRMLLAALALSWLGDVLLQTGNLFIPGLISFLLAHLAYSAFFIKSGRGPGQLQQEPLIGLPVVVFIALFLWLLYPFLSSMRLPVTVYALVIGLMLLLALNQRNRVNGKAATLLFSGALQFVLSDSLLAVNLFAYHHTILSLCVMATYASAQYLMVKGAMASFQPAADAGTAA